MNYLKLKAILVLFFLSLTLLGCSPLLRSNVVTFYDAPLPSGETIRIEPMDSTKMNSLEFRSYAQLIAEELQKIGYNPVGLKDEAELIAQVDYSIDQSVTEVRVKQTRYYSHYHFYYRSYSDPYYFGINDRWDPVVYQSTSYVRKLKLNIVNNNEEANMIFEGRVESTGKQTQLPEIMPYLVTAMFTNFPGENGITKVVTIEMNE